MINRLMKVIVLFDLPVSTKEKRKQYSQFRKNLIKLGFHMLQFSVYARTVRNNDDAKKYSKIIKGILPPARVGKIAYYHGQAVRFHGNFIRRKIC